MGPNPDTVEMNCSANGLFCPSMQKQQRPSRHSEVSLGLDKAVAKAWTRGGHLARSHHPRGEMSVLLITPGLRRSASMRLEALGSGFLGLAAPIMALLPCQASQKLGSTCTAERKEVIAPHTKPRLTNDIAISRCNDYGNESISVL